MDKSSSLGMPISPQEISKKYKCQSLRMPKASPSSSTKISGHLSRQYIFIASYRGGARNMEHWGQSNL
jgi:hypothetical protein